MSNKIIFEDRVEWKNEKGEFHRLDGPAREWNDGAKEWWVDGKLHRDDAPARVSSTSWSWYNNGKRHRLEGPAVNSQGIYEWWFKGVCYYGYQGYYDCLAWEGRLFFSFQQWFLSIPKELQLSYLFYGVALPDDV